MRSLAGKQFVFLDKSVRYGSGSQSAIRLVLAALACPGGNVSYADFQAIPGQMELEIPESRLGPLLEQVPGASESSLRRVL